MIKSQFGVVGNSIRTAEGYYLDLMNPDPAKISIEDIAIGLSNCCRFSGQLPRGIFYSVAEHSCLASKLCYEEWGCRRVALSVLLHDASEAYMGDCVKPLKNLLPGWKAIEDKLQSVIYDKFDVDQSEIVDAYDMAMLRTEKEQLFPGDRTSWNGFEHIEAAPVTILGMAPREARDLFLVLFEKLYRPIESTEKEQEEA